MFIKSSWVPRNDLEASYLEQELDKIETQMAHSGSGSSGSSGNSGNSISTKEVRALEASKFSPHRRLGRYKLERERAARRVQQPAVQAQFSPDTSQNNTNVQEKADAQIVHQKLVVPPSRSNYQTEFDDDFLDTAITTTTTTTSLNRRENSFQQANRNFQFPPSPYGKSFEEGGRRQLSFGAASAPFANDHTWDKNLY